MNDLALLDSKQLWTNKEALQEIKNIYAKGATDTEFATFVGIGKETGLNPFLKEIWFIKFGNNAAQIMISRDGYRTSIGKNPNYESHLVDAVYENDEFEMDPINNKFSHKYNLKNRGRLVGAYCLVFMRNSTRPYYVFCELSEYDLKQSLWKTKPATMVKKVAEAQCIRMADPNRYNGTYSETEMPEEKFKPNENISTESVNGRVIEHEQSEDISQLLYVISNSTNEDELRASAEIIKASNVSQSGRSQLSNAYREKLKALREQPKPVVEECAESKEFFGNEELV